MHVHVNMTTYRLTTVYLVGMADEVRVSELIVNYSSAHALMDFARAAYSQASSISVEEVRS